MVLTQAGRDKECQVLCTKNKMILNELYKRLHDDGTVEYISIPFKPILTHFKDIDFYYLEIHYCVKPRKDNNCIPSYDLENYIPSDILNSIINDNHSHLLINTIEHFKIGRAHV